MSIPPRNTSPSPDKTDFDFGGLMGKGRALSVLIAGFTIGISLTLISSLTVKALRHETIELLFKSLSMKLGVQGWNEESFIILITGLVMTALYTVYGCIELLRERRLFDNAVAKGNLLASAHIRQLRAAHHNREIADELAHTRDQLTQAIEAVSEGFVLFDADNRLVICNSRFKNRYPNSRHLIQPGITFEEILRHEIEFLPPPGAVGRTEAWLAERMERHNNPRGPYEAQSADGRWFRISEKRTPDGGYVSVRTDVTRLKLVEEELKDRVGEMEDSQARLEIQGMELSQLAEDLAQARDESEQAVHTKAEFLATMSHEIRTPMNGVIGMTGMLLDTDLDTDQRVYAESIRESGEALLTIINDILDFSKMEAGKLDLEEIEFDPANIIESVLELLMPRAKSKELGLASYVAPEVPRPLVGDPGRLRQILINLVGNAVKFTAKGTVTVSSSIETVEGNQYLHFDINDTGIGIPKDVQGQLFNRFTQADSSTSRRYGGTGLGLAICHKLTEMMNGEIGLESTPDQGSRFWFRVPLRALPNSRTTTEDNLNGINVLLVKLQNYGTDLFVQQLNNWGVNVSNAHDIAEAEASITTARDLGHPYDVVLISGNIARTDKDMRITAAAAHEGAGSRCVLICPPSEKPRKHDLKARGFDQWIAYPCRETALFNCLATLTGATEARNESLAVAPDGQHVTAEELALMQTRHNNVQLRILIAEDNHVNQLLTVALLNKLGHHAEVAGNGKEAVEAVRSLPYDLVLMDVMMPEMDGFEATAAIRMLPPPKNAIPIIALTANAMPGEDKICLSRGMDDYLAKPVDVAKLASTVKRWGRSRSNTVEADADNAGSTGIGAPPLIDAEALDALMNNVGPAMAHGLIESYCNEAESLHAALTKAHAADDMDGARAAAHDLKSTSGSFGAWGLQEKAKMIEFAARDGNGDLIGDLLPELTRLVDSVIERLTAIIRAAEGAAKTGTPRAIPEASRKSVAS